MRSNKLLTCRSLSSSCCRNVHVGQDALEVTELDGLVGRASDRGRGHGGLSWSCKWKKKKKKKGFCGRNGHGEAETEAAADVPGVEGAAAAAAAAAAAEVAVLVVVEEGAEAAGGVGVVGAWVELSLAAPADGEVAAAAWLRELGDRESLITSDACFTLQEDDSSEAEVRSHLDEELLVGGAPLPRRLARPGPASAPRPP